MRELIDDSTFCTNVTIFSNVEVVLKNYINFLYIVSKVVKCFLDNLERREFVIYELMLYTLEIPIMIKVLYRKEDVV